MPIGVVRYKLELLYRLPKPRLEAKVPFGDILSFLVCRQNVATIKGAFEDQKEVFPRSTFTSLGECLTLPWYSKHH